MEFFDYTNKHHESINITIRVMAGLLNKLKYNSTIFEDEENLKTITLIDLIKANKGNDNVVMFMELLVNFIMYEADSPSIFRHQILLSKRMIGNIIFKILKDNDNEKSMGKLLELFIRFLGGIGRYNDEVSTEIINHPLISKKELVKFIKDKVRKVI